jgi:hypothetical protein
MKIKLLLVALVAGSVIFPAAVRADQIRVEIGDRPFYSHGARYWDGDYEMVWVPGHMSEHGHHWVHGHYLRTEHRRHDMNRHHDGQDYHHDGDRN